MDRIQHHLPAIYAVIALIVVPSVIALVCVFFSRRKARLHREAMLKGNRLHRRWLDQSKELQEP